LYGRAGSPPRAWGQSLAVATYIIARRFTPTGVGTILCALSANFLTPVHPHGRGDNRSAASMIRSVNGSPPRAWGQCWHEHPYADDVRFTPTSVGTILNRRWCSTLRTVHPHGRGDNPRREQANFESDGSPPRAWGQFSLVADSVEYLRFTPTGVGTMYGPALPCPARAVHPHGRGDNHCEHDQRRALNGSPPRAWGQSYQ